MSLQDKILNCNEKDVDTIMQQAIEEADSNSDKVERLGFLENGKAAHLFKGFIPLNTRIKYSNLSIEDYGMQTIDYMYEFAHLIRKHNIDTKGALLTLILEYLEMLTENIYLMKLHGKQLKQMMNILMLLVIINWVI